GGAATWAPAHIASFMAQLIVDLPCCDGFFVPVVPGQGSDNFFAVFPIDGIAETKYVASAIGAGSPVWKLREDLRIFLNQPGGRRGCGRTEDDLQSFLFGQS